jgi:maltose alpha-D-glucosyltransferase / alpha-amylase
VLEPSTAHVLAIVAVGLDDGTSSRYTFALSGEPLRAAAPGDGAWRALAVAMAEGRSIPSLTEDPASPPTAALVCRPARALSDLVPGDSPAATIAAATERDLGADQSNTSVVLGERLLLKAFRRLLPGLNPDLEMTAFLSEEAGFSAVPPLGGYAELVSASHGTATVAMAQAFVSDATDAYESVAETLTAWMLAPGAVSLEFATEIAADLGTLTAGLHAALGDDHGQPDMTPRDATRAEVRAWADRAQATLARALDVTTGDAGRELRALSPRIAEALTVLEALPTALRVSRTHGDYHLGQVLLAPDGYRIVDFEGEPFASAEERREHRDPLRDVASMLRSLDHVGRSAGRRAIARNGGPLESPGLDLPGWLRRARERFLDAYRVGLRQAGRPIDIDPALLRAYEIEKETYEFAYAATYLPSWLWAPTEGMRGLFEETA